MAERYTTTIYVLDTAEPDGYMSQCVQITNPSGVCYRSGSREPLTRREAAEVLLSYRARLRSDPAASLTRTVIDTDGQIVRESVRGNVEIQPPDWTFGEF